MSLECSALCASMLEDYLGKDARTIAETLSRMSWMDLKTLIKFSKLSSELVIDMLILLLKYNFVRYRVNEIGRKAVVEYSLQCQEILWMNRYPRCIEFLDKKFGPIGNLVGCNLVTIGPQSISELILACLCNGEITDNAKEVHDKIQLMVMQKYLIRLPTIVHDETEESKYTGPVPTFIQNSEVDFEMPKVSTKLVTRIPPENAKDKHILWRINIGRLHQEFRHEMIVEAVKRKLGEMIAECAENILRMVEEKDDAWVREHSTPFTWVAIRMYLDTHSVNPELLIYGEQCVKLLAKDSLGLLRELSEGDKELYVIDWATVILNLTSLTLEELVDVRFGAKSRRIFSIVRAKPNIEQSNLHNDVLMPDKECKSATFQLIKENFLHVRPVRRIGTGSGPSSASISYLFHVKTTKLVQTLLNNTYKVLHNQVRRILMEKKQHYLILNKLLEYKSRYGNDAIVSDFNRGITQAEINIAGKVQKRIVLLLTAIQNIDSTLFQWEMYMYHSSKLQIIKPFITQTNK